MDVDYRLRHNDLLANIVHRWRLVVDVVLHCGSDDNCHVNHDDHDDTDDDHDYHDDHDDTYDDQARGASVR